LPAGLNFVDNGNGTATISGTPAAGATGPYTVNLTATNLGGTTGQALAMTVTAGQAPAITSADSASFVAGTESTFSVSATGNPTPALAETGTLPAGLSFVDNGNGTASLSGTPVSSGTTTLEIDATNGVSPPATQALTVAVAAPPPSTGSTSPGTPTAGPSAGAAPAAPVTSATGTGSTGTGPGTPALTVPFFTSHSSLVATVGHQLTFQVSATGYPVPNLADPVLPNGLKWVDNGNGTATIWGVPTTLAAGKTQVPLTAANAAGSAKQMLAITVDRAAGVSNAKLPIAVAGRHYSFTVSAFGYPTPTISESGALPAGLSFSPKANGKAVLWGVPVAGSGGAHHFSVTVSNSLGKTVAHYTLTVGEAPEITSPASARAVHGKLFSFTVKTTGYPGPVFSHTALPPGLKWTTNNNGTATISGSPSARALGRNVIKITVVNAYGKEHFALAITVS
ncbi:MAG TPA: putative Ig domain-containing protein, partial [Acidimicrobiales bacterium]|nr:putative Ig domain-containing protein [Acidimicrobiales bacterium]